MQKKETDFLAEVSVAELNESRLAYCEDLYTMMIHPGTSSTFGETNLRYAQSRLEHARWCTDQVILTRFPDAKYEDPVLKHSDRNQPFIGELTQTLGIYLATEATERLNVLRNMFTAEGANSLASVSGLFELQTDDLHNASTLASSIEKLVDEVLIDSARFLSRGDLLEGRLLNLKFLLDGQDFLEAQALSKLRNLERSAQEPKGVYARILGYLGINAA